MKTSEEIDIENLIGEGLPAETVCAIERLQRIRFDLEEFRDEAAAALEDVQNASDKELRFVAANALRELIAAFDFLTAEAEGLDDDY